MSLRTRVLVSFLPLVLLLSALGVLGWLQLDRTAGQIDAILQENYKSVQAMFRLSEALERMDSSFQFALSAEPGRETEARQQFEANWELFEEQYRVEANNITIFPLERELVDRLRALKDEYRRHGLAFFAIPRGSTERVSSYYGKVGDPGLLVRFRQIKEVSNEILILNRENMEQARDRAQSAAGRAVVGFGIALAVLAALVFGIVWYLLRSILGPIQAVTEGAEAIAESAQLDREVPVSGPHELGRLATAFNSMTRQLRAYRRTNLDRLMRAQRTAQATIDSFPDPILVMDPDGRSELANPAASALLGVGPNSGEPGPVWQPPEALRKPVTEALQFQRDYRPEGFDSVVSFRMHGEDRAFLPQVRPIRDIRGETLGAAVVLNDVTRFRLLDQFKTDLVATVSHELKTPLTAVRLAVHVLLEEAVGPLTPKQTELLIDARDNAERMLSLIEQLLALARLQRPRAREAFRVDDPAEILRRAADAVRSRAEDKHITLKVSADESLPRIAADAERLEQALGNLLNNAVTYTQPGGTVTLSASATTEGAVVIGVADNGVGIPAEYLPQVFDRFFRIPGQSDEAGTGLGLAIVKEVVTAHGGQISCESEPGKGTTFRMTLPGAK
jgi:signal transduction histidine kinase